MVTSFDPLYRAIRDTPDNPASWHVLADALISRGDPRGELLQLLLIDPKGVDRRIRRRQRLLARALPTAPLPKCVSPSFTHGFLTGIRGSVRNLALKDLATCFDRPDAGALYNLALTMGQNSLSYLEALADEPWLHRITSLKLVAGHEFPASATALLAAPPLRSLWRVFLQGPVTLDPALFEVLARLPLRELSLFPPAAVYQTHPRYLSITPRTDPPAPWPDDTVSALLRAPWRLERLKLGRVGLMESGGSRLFGSALLHTVQHLRVGPSGLGPDALDALASQPRPALIEVHLLNNRVGDATQVFSKRSVFPNLRRVLLEHCHVGTAAVQALRSRSFDQLRITNGRTPFRTA
ncbi:MAG: hypothetical protein AAGA48_27900 [Myxococcota bacterium]